MSLVETKMLKDNELQIKQTIKSIEDIESRIEWYKEQTKSAKSLLRSYNKILHALQEGQRDWIQEQQN